MFQFPHFCSGDWGARTGEAWARKHETIQTRHLTKACSWFDFDTASLQHWVWSNAFYFSLQTIILLYLKMEWHNLTLMWSIYSKLYILTASLFAVFAGCIQLLEDYFTFLTCDSAFCVADSMTSEIFNSSTQPDTYTVVHTPHTQCHWIATRLFTFQPLEGRLT